MPLTSPPAQEPRSQGAISAERGERLAESRPAPRTAPALSAREHPFTTIYLQHVERIYRYHLVRTGSVDDAQDLTAETFQAALEGFAAFDPARGCAAAWLAGIARHKLADHFRRSPIALPIAQIEDQPDPAPTTEEAGARHLQIAQVSAALRSLSADRAEALSLHFFAGLSLDEAAQAMRRSEEAVKKLIHRGLGDLRRLLALPPTAADSVEVNE